MSRFPFLKVAHLPFYIVACFSTPKAFYTHFFPFTLIFSILQPRSGCYSQVAAEETSLAASGPHKKRRPGSRPQASGLWATTLSLEHSCMCRAFTQLCMLHAPPSRVPNRAKGQETPERENGTNDKSLTE